MKKFLITGTAGFIGFHLSKLLLGEGHKVHGYDGMTDYYDVNLKKERHNILFKNINFSASEGMLENYSELDKISCKCCPINCSAITPSLTSCVSAICEIERQFKPQIAFIKPTSKNISL